MAMCMSLAVGAACAALTACSSDEAHVHNMQSVAAVAATCTEAGHSAYYYCPDCENYYSDEAGENQITLDSTVVAALGHDMTSHAAVEATCATNGNTAYYSCDRCGNYYSDEAGATAITLADTVVAAKGHTIVAVAEVPTTCTTDGCEAYYKCSACGGTFSDAEGKTAVDPSTLVVEAKGHDLDLVSEVPATCTTDGCEAYYECSVCEATFSDAEGKTAVDPSTLVVEAKGHDLDLVSEVPATCTTDGCEAYYECSVCEATFSDAEGKTAVDPSTLVVEAKGHDLDLVEESPATCTTDGCEAYYKCSACGETFSDAEGKMPVAPSTLVIKSEGHDIDLVAEVSATCEKDGCETYYKCSACGETFSDVEGKTPVDVSTLTIKSTGHTLSATVDTEPSATTAGSATVSCEKCDYSDTLTLPALTEENVENGTYNLSLTYKYESARFYRYNIYAYNLAQTDPAIVSADEMIFEVKSDTYLTSASSAQLNKASVSGTINSTATRTIDFTLSLDEAQYGIGLVRQVSGWYKFTITTADVDVVATLIGDDGTIRDIITSSDNLSNIFELESATRYIIVLHSAGTETESIAYTIEQTTIPTVTTEVSATFSIDAAVNYRTGEGSAPVSILVGDDVPEGHYILTITGTVQLGKNYNFDITVGDDSYNTETLVEIDSTEFAGQIGAGVSGVFLKAGDIISISNVNMPAFSNISLSIIPVEAE